MKTVLLVVLALSLAGNVILSLKVSRSPEGRPDSTVATPSIGGATSISRAATSAAASEHDSASAGSASLQWPMVSSPADLTALVARLRAAGFPPSVVRAVVQQQLNELFRDRRAESSGPFWKQRGGSPERVAAQQALDKEQRELLDSLLGADARPSRTMDADTRARRYGGMADEKIDAIEAINRDYANLLSQVHSGRATDQQTMQERMKQSRFLQEEQRKDIAALLTPAELDQYEMRTSSSAMQVMSRLRGVDVSEEEYVALYRQQKAFDDANPAINEGRMTPETLAARNRAQDEQIQKARAVLTDDRFYEYLKGVDYRYNQTTSFTSKYPSITPATTYQLYQLERSAQATLSQLSANLTIDQRRAQLEALGSDFNARVQALVGPQIGEAYVNQGVGRMIKQLGRPTPPGTLPAVALPIGGG